MKFDYINRELVAQGMIVTDTARLELYPAIIKVRYRGTDVSAETVKKAAMTLSNTATRQQISLDTITSGPVIETEGSCGQIGYIVETYRISVGQHAGLIVGWRNAECENSGIKHIVVGCSDSCISVAYKPSGLFIPYQHAAVSDCPLFELGHKDLVVHVIFEIIESA